ncbi:hypothetical protein FB451DRAFT_322058 [Mycena latifolia]|nr:hypothetical protein FB451DRAFT_322058 [Mycena latifolia]
MTTFSTCRSANGTVVVVPFMMAANTDTRHYWGISRHIFRYGHRNSAGRGPEEAKKGVHTVNESIDADDFVEIIRFFITLVLNADESTVLQYRACICGGLVLHQLRFPQLREAGVKDLPIRTYLS